MRITTDSFFTIGKHHVSSCTPCEDYAHSGMLLNGIHYAGISDGCSASEDSDVGARALLHWFRYYLRKKECVPQEPGESLFSEWDRDPLIESLQKDLKPLLLRLGNAQALDATLNFAFMHRKYHGGAVFMQGDGLIGIKRLDKTSPIYFNVEWDESMPPYLSYLLDDVRRYDYREYTRKLGAMGKLITFDTDGNTDVDAVSSFAQVDFGGFIIPFSPQQTEYIAVFSDGISSFPGKTTFQAASDFMQFKSWAPQFVKRNCNRVLRQYKKEGIEPGDDFSMAVLRIEHESKETAPEGGFIEVQSRTHA